MITLDRRIGTLFQQFLKIPERCQLFCNRLDLAADAIEPLLEHEIKVTGIVCEHGHHPSYHERYENSLEFVDYPDLDMFQPLDKFHLGFSVFPFDFNYDHYDGEKLIEVAEKDAIKPQLLKDKCSFFRCSVGKPDRMAPYHLIGLEMLLKATFCGGYFAAVLPKRWIGREMRYMHWWNDHAAEVARIKLPKGAVWDRGVGIPEPVNRAVPGDWELRIWNRPAFFDDATTDIAKNSVSNKHFLSYAEFRYSPFIFPLESLNSESIKKCCEAFQQHEWWKMNVSQWHHFLKAQKNNHAMGTYKSTPVSIDNPKEIYFFNPRPEFATGLRIVKDRKEMAKIRHAVHVQVQKNIKINSVRTGNLKEDLIRTKYVQGAMLDLKVNAGLITSEQDGSLIFKYDQDLKQTAFADLKEKLLQDIENVGLVPCMTEDEYGAMLRRERWLQLQLAPIERLVPVGKEAQQTGSEQSTEEQHWELLYQDMGMHATFPEVMQMWRERARQMNMHHHLFDFQFEDVLYMAAKSSLLNANVPGLGKTRETLFAALLRGVSRMLIVLPKKLMGVWKDEIDNTLLPYCMQQRVDWQGKMLDVSYQEIEWARDCLPANFKKFNLISYDKLKSTPRDGMFFKCPQCGTVVYSPTNSQPQYCPGDPSLPEDSDSRCNNIVAKWRRVCAGDPELGRLPRRKYHVLLDDFGNVVKREDGQDVRVHVRDISTPENPTGKFPLERIKVVDTRPSKPTLPVMEPQENVYKKMKKIQVGYEEDKDTGRKTPIYRQVERASHVKWTFSELLRDKFNHIAADEALYFVNEDSMRSQGIFHLCGVHRIPLTGTPFKNKPENVLPLLNWAFKRYAFPMYRSYVQGGTSKFLNKYQTVVYIGGKEIPDDNGGITTTRGQAKPIPKVNNPELFQTEMAPYMLRHVRNEPPVVKDVPRKKLVQEDLRINMDPVHKAYYQLWLAEFAEWWARMKEEEEGKNAQGALITKLTYLINCSTAPSNMLDNILKGKDVEFKKWAQKIGTYKKFCQDRGFVEKPTAKLRKACELAAAAAKVGDKSIIYSIRRANLDIGNNILQKKYSLSTMIVDGTVSLETKKGEMRSERHKMIEQFKFYNYNTLLAGLEALAEGMNIPEANRGYVLDTGWEPTRAIQGIGRMNRPAQKKTIYSTYLMHNGTIDDYMFALCYLKGRSADEAIDYMEFDDFSTAIIPDIHQYADAVVDGTEEILKRRMWLAVDHIKRQIEEEGDDGSDD